MKRIIFTIMILTAFAVIPGIQQTLYADEDYTIRTGLNFTPALVYNRSWDPGYNGSAATLSLVRESDVLMLEAGAEAGYSYTGFSLLFPVKAGILLSDNENIKLYATAALMPGLMLNRPEPYVLFAAEIAAMANWMVSDSFSLGLSAGPRYTASPGYSSEVAPLELVDLTIGFSSGFRL